MSLKPAPIPTSPDRFGRLIERRDGLDFPYYNARPVVISGGGWWLVVASVVVAFAALVALPGFTGPVLAFVPAVVFVAIPLLVLRWVAPTGWTAIFRRVALARRAGQSSRQFHSLRARNAGSSESGTGAVTTSRVSTLTKLSPKVLPPTRSTTARPDG